VAIFQGLFAVWAPCAVSGKKTHDPVLHVADAARQKHEQNHKEQQLCLRYAACLFTVYIQRIIDFARIIEYAPATRTAANKRLFFIVYRIKKIGFSVSIFI